MKSEWRPGGWKLSAFSVRWLVQLNVITIQQSQQRLLAWQAQVCRFREYNDQPIPCHIDNGSHAYSWMQETGYFKAFSTMWKPRDTLIDYLISVNQYWWENNFHRMNDTWTTTVRKYTSWLCNSHHWLTLIQLIAVFYKFSSIMWSLDHKNGHKLIFTVLFTGNMHSIRTLLCVGMVYYHIVLLTSFSIASLSLRQFLPLP